MTPLLIPCTNISVKTRFGPSQAIYYPNWKHSLKIFIVQIQHKSLLDFSNLDKWWMDTICILCWYVIAFYPSYQECCEFWLLNNVSYSHQLGCTTKSEYSPRCLYMKILFFCYYSTLLNIKLNIKCFMKFYSHINACLFKTSFYSVFQMICNVKTFACLIFRHVPMFQP